MGTFRTVKAEKEYKAFRKGLDTNAECQLCIKKPIKTFEYCNIVQNVFPYDKIAQIHHMIIPKRHISEDKLSKQELKELLEIKELKLHGEYDYIIEATMRRKSIPAHFHLHLIVIK